MARMSHHHDAMRVEHPPHPSFSPVRPVSIVRMATSPPYWNKKTSLDFICSPPSQSVPSNPKVLHRLDTLPRELLSNIGYYVVVATTETRGRPHPSAILPLLLTSRTIHDALALEFNPKLYNRLFRATFDHAALTRRYAWMASNLNDLAKSRNTFDLFADPKSWAMEYKDRWIAAKSMRTTAKICEDGRPGDVDTDTVVADTWTAWFLITEHGMSIIPGGSC